jgi:rhodanese-related sulfurtransferase
MKRFFSCCCVLSLTLLFTGFFWGEPTWEEINSSIDHQYPTVKNLDVDTLKAALDQGQPPVLIDVREKDEFAVSHLPNAVNFSNAHAVAYPKDTAIVVYCSVGFRSAAFAKELAEQGFTNVRNLRGSIFAWANLGYPLRRGFMPTRAVHPYNKKWGTLLKEELHIFSVAEEVLKYPGEGAVGSEDIRK